MQSAHRPQNWSAVERGTSSPSRSVRFPPGVWLHPGRRGMSLTSRAYLESKLYIGALPYLMQCITLLLMDSATLSIPRISCATYRH